MVLLWIFDQILNFPKSLVIFKHIDTVTVVRETENTVDFVLCLKLLPSFFLVKMNDVLLAIANDCRMKIKFVEAIDCVVVAA